MNVIALPVTPALDLRGIDRLPSGRFRLRLQTKHRKVNKVFPTADEAVRVRDAMLREIADAAMVPVEGVSIKELGPRFLKKRDGNRNARTDAERWERHVATAPFAHRALSTITRRDVIEWLDALRVKETSYTNRPNKPLSWQTRKHCLVLLRRFFSWAVDLEYAPANPTIGMRVLREDGDEDEGYQDGWYLEPAEQQRLLDLGDPTEKWIAAFAIGTGIRQGELNCLHLADVHVDGPAPYVEIRYGSWDAKNKRYRSPKGRKGDKRTRRVPLFAIGLEAARRWLEILPSYAKKNPLGLMFPTQRGARRTKAPRSWRATVEAFGVIPRIGRKPWWHLLRHTCASSLVAGWWGKRCILDDVKAILGHSSVKVTERYAKLAPDVVDGIGTAIQAGWEAKCHAAVTPHEIPGEDIGVTRPSKPRVTGSNPVGRATVIPSSRA